MVGPWMKRHVEERRGRARGNLIFIFMHIFVLEREREGEEIVSNFKNSSFLVYIPEHDTALILYICFTNFLK